MTTSTETDITAADFAAYARGFGRDWSVSYSTGTTAALSSTGAPLARATSR